MRLCEEPLIMAGRLAPKRLSFDDLTELPVIRGIHPRRTRRFTKGFSLYVLMFSVYHSLCFFVSLVDQSSPYRVTAGHTILGVCRLLPGHYLLRDLFFLRDLRDAHVVRWKHFLQDRFLALRGIFHAIPLFCARS